MVAMNQSPSYLTSMFFFSSLFVLLLELESMLFQCSYIQQVSVLSFKMES